MAPTLSPCRKSTSFRASDRLSSAASSRVGMAINSRCGCFGRLVLAGAGLDLDGDVAEAADSGEPRLVDGGRPGPVRDQGHDSGAVARADAPEMQVRDPVVGFGFEALRDLADDPVS